MQGIEMVVVLPAREVSIVALEMGHRPGSTQQRGFAHCLILFLYRTENFCMRSITC